MTRGADGPPKARLSSSDDFEINKIARYLMGRAKEYDEMSATSTNVCAVSLIIGLAGVFSNAHHAFAQCDPPGANTKCWDNGGLGPEWSDHENWDPFGVPADSDDVFHLIGGEIEFDMGTPSQRIPIQSFTFDPAAQSGLAMNAGTGLDVAGSFVSQQPPGTALYDLTLGSQANMAVGGDVAGVNAQLVSGAGPSDRTVMWVDGAIGAGNWVVDRDAYVRANLGADLTGAPDGANEWTVRGQAELAYTTLGDGRWLADGSGDNLGLLTCSRSFEAAEIVARNDAYVLTGWVQTLSDEELRDSIATFEAGAEKYAGTPVGYQFAFLANALGD